MSRNTVPIISKYELAAVLAERAAEIADNQPITIQNPGTTNPVDIARLEFAAGKSPKKIIRTYPDGRTEIWGINELQVI